MTIWASCHIFEPTSELDIQKELLWHNTDIQIDGSPICWRQWEYAGIRHINHLLHPSESRFFSHEEINQEYGINTSFLQLLQIRSAIPFSWRTKLQSCSAHNLTVHPTISAADNQPLDLTKLTSRKVYASLIIRQKPNVSSQRKWNTFFPVADDVSHDYWAEIYRRPYRNARDTKLQAFQFRVIHRTLPCNKYLSNLLIHPVDTCTFCQDSDTIEHFLYHCPQTKALWANVCAWMDREVDVQLSVSVRAVLFGIPDDAPDSRVVNFLLLFVKFYIYRQKLFHSGSFSMVQLLRELRTRLQVEQFLTTLENKRHRFRIWSRLYNALA